MHGLGLKIKFWFRGEFQDWIEVELWLRSVNPVLKAEGKILYCASFSAQHWFQTTKETVVGI